MAGAENLRKELLRYDGKHPDILLDISRRHRAHASFMGDLIELAADQEAAVSEGATWIIKAELESGRKLSPKDVQRLLGRIEGVTAWQAQLHICQSIGYLTLPKDLEPDMERWLRKLLNSPRPFLRAWVVDALCRLYGASPKAQDLLRQMQSDPAASVRARVSNLRRQLTEG